MAGRAAGSTAYLRRQASEAGLRIIGIDRPGYGLSAPQPGRTIAGWVPGALAVADYLGIGQFAAVGTSTGGAYALAPRFDVRDSLTGVGSVARRAACRQQAPAVG